MVILGINHLYIALMSFKYNITLTYLFMLPWEWHIKAGHLVLQWHTLFTGQMFSKREKYARMLALTSIE